MRPQKLGLDYIPLNIPLNRKLVKASMIGGSSCFGLYQLLMAEIGTTGNKILSLEYVLSEYDVGVDKGITVRSLDVLVSVGLISINGDIISIPEVNELLDKVMGTRSQDRIRKSDDKKSKELEKEIGVSNTDYKSLVQQWNSLYPMSLTRLKTSYSRFKFSNSWDPETVTKAIEFISNNPGIKNKIMCDWFDAGFFLPGYEFDVDTINNHFSKKGKANSVKKSNTTDPTGCSVNYNEQGWDKPVKKQVVVIENTMDEHMKRMLDAAGV